jgi:hypothetical protein
MSMKDVMLEQLLPTGKPAVSDVRPNDGARRTCAWVAASAPALAFCWPSKKARLLPHQAGGALP